jgi:NhaA family Na+:H+ antiporter
MTRPAPRQDLPRAQLLTERALASLDRFLHIEAVSGLVLLTAAIAALIWANSLFASSYHEIWHAPLAIELGHFAISQSLHFWINDGLMTVFFLVVGMEIRREIHEGALTTLRQAALPIAAAVGGVAVPALIYLSFNTEPLQQSGWAIPTATDIAFAMGVLALLGRGIPGNVRIFLLALAIIDDIIAVLIIALFYSGGLDYNGFAIAGLGVLLVLALQRMGIGSAWAYVAPGAIVWGGLLTTGAHPTLAGVVLGLLTPVVPVRLRERPQDLLSRIAAELRGATSGAAADSGHVAHQLRQLRLAQRELLPPVIRVQSALHPWVAYGVMPLFALANAGVTVAGTNLSADGAQWVTIGIALALVAGKPLGIVGTSWLVVRLGWCRLPPRVSWQAMVLIGLLAGIGFTMSIFITTLAFLDQALLGAAKLGVLLGSLIAVLLGMTWGFIYVRQRRIEARGGQDRADTSAAMSAPLQ